MSDFDELKKRVKAAEGQFGMMSRQRRDYGQRLIDMIALHERDLAQTGARMAALREDAHRAEALARQREEALQVVQGENEQLRTMLHSLLRAIESGRSNDFEETMHELDRRISTMVQVAQGELAATAQAVPPLRDVAEADDGETAEDDPGAAGEATGIAFVGADAGLPDRGDWFDPDEETAAIDYGSRPPSMEEVFRKVDSAVAEAEASISAVPDEEGEDWGVAGARFNMDQIEEGGLKGASIAAIADSIAAESREDVETIRPGRTGSAFIDRADDGLDDDDSEEESDETPFDLLDQADAGTNVSSLIDRPARGDRLFGDEDYGDPFPAVARAAETLPREARQSWDSDLENEFDLSDLELGGEIEDLPETEVAEAETASRQQDRFSRAASADSLIDSADWDEPDDDDGFAPPAAPPADRGPAGSARRGTDGAKERGHDAALAELDAILAEADVRFAVDTDVMPTIPAFQGEIEEERPAARPRQDRSAIGSAPPKSGRSGLAPAVLRDLDDVTREEILARVRERHSARTGSRED